MPRCGVVSHVTWCPCRYGIPCGILISPQLISPLQYSVYIPSPRPLARARAQLDAAGLQVIAGKFRQPATRATSAPGLHSPLPHLRLDCAALCLSHRRPTYLFEYPCSARSAIVDTAVCGRALAFLPAAHRAQLLLSGGVGAHVAPEGTTWAPPREPRSLPAGSSHGRCNAPCHRLLSPFTAARRGIWCCPPAWTGASRRGRHTHTRAQHTRAQHTCTGTNMANARSSHLA